MALVRAVSAFHYAGGFLEQNSLWDDSDPLVKAHPDWFTEDFAEQVNSSVPRKPEVEQTTAAPGEKRATKRG
jgi:hypothetical protein